MSYILDALRRADAERERGAVPGLSSQQHAYVEDDAAKPQRSRMLVWAVVALAAALVVAVAWNFVGGAGPSTSPRPIVEGSVSPAPPVAPVLLPTTPSPAETLPPATVTASPATTAQAPPSAQASAEAASAAPAAPVQPPRAATKHAPEPKRVARRNVEPEPAPAPANTAAANTTTAKAAEPKTAEPKAAARTATEGRVYQQAELPDDVRRDLPKLVIGGASYSGDPASRMVMINGQIFHEGDQLAPQLVLERIKLKSAVLSYKGYRYELTF